MYHFKSDLSMYLLQHYFMPHYYKKENINLLFLNKLVDKFFISSLFNDELHKSESNKIDKFIHKHLRKFGKLDINFEEDSFRQSYCLSMKMTKYRKTYFSVNITIHRNGYFIVDKMIDRNSASHRLLKNKFMGYFCHHNNNIKTINVIYDFTYKDYCNIDSDYNAYLIKKNCCIPLQEMLSINDDNMTIEYIYDSDFNNNKSIRYMLFYNKYSLNVQKTNEVYQPMFDKKDDSYFRDISEITSNYLNEKEIDMRLITEDDLEIIAMIDC